jgi:aminoglycoside phosphotransferase (APT) family kinase protein
MSGTIGRSLAAGNVAEVFEWGSRVVKLYRSPARKPTAFREAAIHAAVEAMALPVHGQPARQLGCLKSRLATNIACTGLLDEPLKQILFGRLADMPDGDRLCHGDFHPINVLGQNSQPMVIDWPDACCGDPAADVCRSYLLLNLHAEDIVEPYLDAYCSITNTPRAKILDWLHYVAAARLAEDVPDDWARLLEIVHA